MAAINVNISISIFKLKQRNTHVLSVPPKALVVGCADVGGTQGQNNMERVDSLVKGKMMMKPSVGLLCQFSKSMVAFLCLYLLFPFFPSVLILDWTLRQSHRLIEILCEFWVL